MKEISIPLKPVKNSHRFKYGTIIFLIALIISSCGLPDYQVLDPPKFTSTTDYTVGFTTPDDDLIDGYIIYYKIYIDNDNSISSEKDRFDDDGDLLSGTSLPESLHFFKLGFLNATSNDNYYSIPWTESGSEILFDFTQALNQTSDPVLYIDGNNFTTLVDNGIPARGVKYSAVYSGGDSTYNTFKRFIKNYEFDPYLDDDLKLINNELDSNGSSKIEIAFVAISTGISASTLEQMMSIPVYLGTVEINNVEDNGSNTKIDS